ncbi:MAG: PfkB family carbohydrate kinase [Chloroflexales bacterium]|nr:PfkB family carbohydrate kinase [Chloroflexales bacterium]
MPPDYLVIGHITRDLLPSQQTASGGTVLYAATTAHRLGFRSAVFTAADNCPDTMPFAVNCLSSPVTSTFENRYHNGTREQIVHTIATPLDLDYLPQAWRTASVVHLGPILHECQLDIVNAFPNALIGVTPQGWMRRWNRRLPSAIQRIRWQPDSALLQRINLLVLSIEDVGGDESLVVNYAQDCRLVALTRGVNGLTLYREGVSQDIPAAPATEVDPTGAGDVFAAAMLVSLYETGNAVQAAHFAAKVAARSVEGFGVDAVPTREQIDTHMRHEL